MQLFGRMAEPPDLSGSFIDASMDYVYTGTDQNCFPICCTCGDHSPFMIYLGNNKNSIRFQPQAGRIQLFCPACVPDPDHFRKSFPGEQLFRGDSILNSRKFLDLLDKYAYRNPYYKLYANVDRIIITENSKLCAAYKTVGKRKVPRSIKMKLLMNLFPVAHRLPNEKHASPEDLCKALEEKYREICGSYMSLSETGGSQLLLDNIDIMIDRTPMAQRQTSSRTVHFLETESNSSIGIFSNSSAGNDLLDDSDKEMRAHNDSDDERSSISRGRRNQHTSSSSGSGSSFQVSSGEGSGVRLIQPSSQSQRSQSTAFSIDISSQSVAAPSVASDDSGTRLPRATRRRQSPRTEDDDDQEAGPSSAKQRRPGPGRLVRPMNPSPDEVRDDPLGRLPRFPGG